jgi:hypothetical protein
MFIQKRGGCHCRSQAAAAAAARSIQGRCCRLRLTCETDMQRLRARKMKALEMQQMPRRASEAVESCLRGGGGGRGQVKSERMGEQALFPRCALGATKERGGLCASQPSYITGLCHKNCFGRVLLLTCAQCTPKNNCL